MGSNLGDRRQTLDLACTLLERGGVRIISRSRLYWTRPWGVTDQPPFLNAAISVKTHLRPLELLWRCLQVEAELGRRRLVHWGARRLDLDLILYGNMREARPELTLPHPLLARRDFVLAPLIDLNAPPPASVAPRGWGALLAELAPEERTIVCSAPWR
jgi:2-amino-4-hydroxy-6-hydroxymethyldihydropteridine diphosphokinase